MFDEIDAKILTIVQQDARISNAEIARQIGMAPSAIFERIRKLESQGVIQGYHTRLSAEALDLRMLAFVFVRTNDINWSQAEEILADIPGVQELHHVAGEDCYLLKVRVASPQALGQLLREQVHTIPSVTSTHSTIVLNTIKETAELPVEFVR
jgi:Lrp/AsnC family leucine-responsive transcriptional regulator